MRATQAPSQRPGQLRILDLYRQIELTAGQRCRWEVVALTRLQRHFDASLAQLNRATALAAEITDEGTRLETANDAMIVPADLYAEVRERLDDESRDAERERALLAKAYAEDERRLREALDILEDAAATYASADPALRRQLNQTVFRRILIGAEQDIRIELNDDYNDVVSSGEPDLQGQRPRPAACLPGF